ncbi:uncharacterized protein LOC103954955 [Pyrus x bretschneideri]|uniref:uncharacterized protein LOC103954955 n=1 Tax=Pyrus x bretschneideri TaxID=225117 RepID=UPI00202FC38B|nr:uncharacterized protein LOC103954955 [Pyrus x bretschneideri]
MAMQMAQYQTRIEIEDVELFNAEVELINSFMQYEHHGESSHRGSVIGLVNHDHYFARRLDAAGRQGLSPHQKLTSGFRMLANRCSADSIDEYCRLVESTAIENLKCFYKAIEGIYGAIYLRNPNREDLKKLLRKADKRGFIGMIESLDCMHWDWKNCPTAWASQFKGRHDKPIIVLEAVASYDIWIWHAFFDAPGSNNDINVLWSSPLFDNVVNGWAPEFQYKVNGNRYELGHYLTDGIYPSWSTFVKSFSHPDSAKKKLFSHKQESYLNDVERAFEILQA